MKTTGVRPNAAPPRETPRAECVKKTGAFSKAMADAAAPPPPSLMTPLPPMAPESAATGTKQVRAVLLPPALEGVVREIEVSLRDVQSSEVRIQFDSKTLDGLQVRIARENGKLAVEMNCRSAEVGRLLLEHVGGLGQTLEARGYPGATIEVRSSARSTSQQGRGDGGQREGGHQGGRQR